MGCNLSHELHEDNVRTQSCSSPDPLHFKLPPIHARRSRSLSHNSTAAASAALSAVQLHSPTESRPNSTQQIWMQQQLQHQQFVRDSPDDRTFPRTQKHSPPGLTSDIIHHPNSHIHHSRPRPIHVQRRLPVLPHQEATACSNDATPTFPSHSPCSMYRPTEVEIVVGQPEIPVNDTTATANGVPEKKKKKSHCATQITVQAADGSAEPDVIPIQDADSYAKMYYMYSDSLPEYQEYKKNWELEQEKFKHELALKERGVFHSPSRSIFTPEESRAGTPASSAPRSPCVSSPVPGGQLIANGTALCIMIENSRPESVATSPIPGYKIAFDNHSLVPGSPSSMVLADHPDMLNPISPGVTTPKLSLSRDSTDCETLRVPSLPRRISFHHNLHVPHHQPNPSMYTLREQNEPTEMDWGHVESRLNRLVVESSA